MSLLKLPSGSEIDLNKPDFSQCRGPDDLMDLKYALSEKNIDIELQIDLHGAGTSTTTVPTWLPRAKAALKWAKLYRDEAQNRQGRATEIERQKIHLNRERCVIDILKARLPAAEFQRILSAADLLLQMRDDDQRGAVQ